MVVGGKLLRAARGMARIFIQQHRDAPAAIMLIQGGQKRPEVVLRLTVTHQKQTRSRTEIHRPENDSASIPTGEQNAAWFSSSAPVGTQRREQQQIGLVLRQQDGSRRQTADFPTNSAFFSRAPGRAAKHTGLASMHIPAATARVGWCGWKTARQCMPPTGREAMAHSSSRHNNPVRPDHGPRALPATPSIPLSSASDDLNDHRPPGSSGRAIRGTPQSSDEYFGDSSVASERFLQAASPDGTPARSTSAGTLAHHASASTAARADGARIKGTKTFILSG